MVIFDQSEDARDAEAHIRELQGRLGVQPEFKFNKTRPAIRDAFFRSVVTLRFRVRAIVVRKSVIRSDRLKDHKDEFYRYFVKSMVQHDGDRLDGARVIIDGSGEKLFRQDLERHLKRHCDGVRSVKFADSRKDRLVQLADMVAGAIARCYREDRKDAYRWADMLKPKIDNIWNFK